VILFHRTDRAAARRILKQGFRDGFGSYGTRTKYSGVWLSDVPLDENEGACGDALLRVAIRATEEELTAFEWVEEGKGYREFLIPASWLKPRIFALKIQIRCGKMSVEAD